ncbi:MAG: hypothetical protein GX444_14035 [Myxococcales bacterium]|nr:hypothetical protein [Myxococcales bacterium]
MKRCFFVLSLLLLLWPVFAFAGDIEGTYNCEGTNPNGGAYKGTVSIIKNDANYNVTWTIGAQVYVGVGLLEGDSFAVGYADTKQGWFGIVVYKVKGDKLSGSWAMHGSGKNGTETLTRR